METHFCLCFSQCCHYKNKSSKIILNKHSKSFWELSVGLTDQTIGGTDFFFKKKKCIIKITKQATQEKYHIENMIIIT